MDELYDKANKTGVKVLEDLYNILPKTSVITAGGEAITQASSVGLMQDSFGNIRYYGADPNNYVTFNGEAAGWRIIGVFDTENENGIKSKRIKLIRATSIGEYSYNASDKKYTQVKNNIQKSKNVTPKLMAGVGGICENYVCNSDWINADINYELNSIYYNRNNGSCYKTSTTSSAITCDFTTNGLTDKAKTQIDKIKYYLGNYKTSDTLYADSCYNLERGKEVYSGYSTIWYGYVGLMYASDYAYSTDLKTCTKDIENYNNNCQTYLGYSAWTLLVTSEKTVLVSGIGLNNNLSNTGSNNHVYPVLYLNPNIQIVNGTGTQSDPYQLK